MESVLQKPRLERRVVKPPVWVMLIGIAMIATGGIFAFAGGSFFLEGTREISATIGASTVLSGLAAAAGVTDYQCI